MKEPEPGGSERPGAVSQLFRRVWTSIGAANISLAGGGFLALIVGFISWVFFHEIRPFSYSLMAIGGLLILTAFLASYRQVAPALTGRRSRFGTNTLVMSLLVIGIAMLVNFLGYTNDSRVDLTATRQFTLAQRTAQILRGLETDLQATAFFRTTDPEQQWVRQQVDDLLHEFDRRSGNFSYRFVDPDTDLITAKEYAITKYQSVVFENLNDGTRQTVMTPPVTEEDFVTALLIVSGQQRKRVYFLTGHGERDSYESERDEGYWFAYNGLIHDNYEPYTLNLLSQREVPEDAAAVIIAGPQKDFVEGEERALDQYLLNGGRLLLLLDPDTPDSIREFVRNWGVKMEDGVVLDMASSVGGDPAIPLLERHQYSASDPDLTEALDVTFFPQVAALSPAEEEMATIDFRAIARSSTSSWLVNDPAQTAPTPADPQGPFFLAVVVDALAPLALLPDTTLSGKWGRLVVIGDSDFPANRYFYAFTNGDLFLNSVNWLTDDVTLISIRPKPIVFRDLVLTTRERDFFRYSTWFLLPIAMLALAGVAWWRRR